MRRLSLTVLSLTAALSLAACGSSSSGSSPSAASAASAAIASSSAAASAPAASASASASASAVPGNGVSDPAAAKAEITKLYNTFFQAPVPKAKTLLQDGSTLNAAFKAALKLKGTAQERGKVKSVTITGPGTATVVFALLIGGKVVLPSSDGAAVYVGTKWLVAKQTFCTLVSLGGATPKGCT